MASRASVSTLHARLNLPASFAHSTLQRCLIDPTISKTHNNAGLASHGKTLLGYYISSYLVTRYPRLPYKATTNALIAYAGWKTLAAIGRGWGVSGNSAADAEKTATTRPRRVTRTTTTAATTTMTAAATRKQQQEDAMSLLQVVRVPPGHAKVDATTNYLDMAYADFVRSIVGGLQIHASAKEVREFIEFHFLSRDVNLFSSFRILQPQRELSFLCAREGLERPVTRLMAETGRRSNAPVFVVGVYSGTAKLGEGQASSMREAEYLAQSNAMKSWYLFEDTSATLSSTTLEGEVTDFRPSMIDVGDVVV